MPARDLREILWSRGEIDAAVFARIVFDSEDLPQALLKRAGSELANSSPDARTFVHAATAVLMEASEVNSDDARVLQWFCSARLPLFDNKTPAEVTASGLVAPLIDYIRSLDAGWTG